MGWDSLLVLVVSTIGLVLVGYVVLTVVFRAISRPTLLLPWMRSARASELEARGTELLAERLSQDDRHIVQRALNTLRIPGARSLTAPWADSDPILDAEKDIQSVWSKLHGPD